MKSESPRINPYLEGNFNGFVKSCIEKIEFVDLKIISELVRFSRFGNDNGYLKLNVPLDMEGLIRTPKNHREVVEKNNFQSESTLTIFGSILGHIYGYESESSGLMFNNIRPTEANKKEQSSESSDVFLELHKEIAFHDISPDFLLLYCLRGDREHKALTGVSSIRKAIKFLTEPVQEELRKCKFKIGIDFSFESTKGVGNEKTISILSGPTDDPYMTYDADLITPIDEASEEALKALDVALRKSMDWSDLQAGDLIIIDNNRTVHSRTSYKPKFDGKDRWLQRIFVKANTVEPEMMLEKKLSIIA